MTQRSAEEIAREIVDSLHRRGNGGYTQLECDIAQAIATERKACAWPSEDEVAEYMDKKIGGYDYHARLLYRYLRTRLEVGG